MSIVESPTYAWRVLAYGQSDLNDRRIFPEREILAAAVPSPLPAADEALPETVTYPTAGGLRSEPLSALLQRTGTRAFLVVHNDRLVHEAYIDSDREAVHTSFSSAKSVNSALIGAAIADGLIGSVDDRVIAYIPEIAGRGLDALTIRDLLLMNSGIRYLGNDEIPFYREPLGDDTRTYYSGDMRRLALGVTAGATPIGASFRYNNYHPLLEGLILERATGMPVAQYLEERLWQPMGAEFSASWSLDSQASGFEKMESGLNARAVDYARFGLVFLHRGLWNGQRILPGAWVETSTEPPAPGPARWEVAADWPQLGGYYAYHWWGLANTDGTHDFSAIGRYGQLVYVAPRKNAVVVRLGEERDPAVNWPLVIRSIVDALP
jgi:CubicO group peptidase (beta-lactamase class C family)